MIALIIAIILLTAANIYLLMRLRTFKEFISKISIASKAKSLFMQKLAYEFRNPLNGISGFAQMLEAGYFGELSAQQKERVHDIFICSTQLHNFIKNLIDLSKGESGGMELIEAPIQFSTLIEKAIEEVKNKIINNKIRVVTNLDSNNYEIIGDSNKLTEAFKNIIDNAVKFSYNGGQVTIKQIYIPNQFLQIIIADSGRGMSFGELQSLFLFPDDTNKATNFNNGLGIGMPLTKLFIELHGGVIEVDSEENLGTTVTVSLPDLRLKK